MEINKVINTESYPSEEKIQETMDYYKIDRQFAIDMLIWVRDHGDASDHSIAQEYGQGRYMGD